MSSVGSRRDDPSLKDLAATLRAGKLARENGSPNTTSSSRSSDRGSLGSGESSSRAASVGTAEALSLCGMKFNESVLPPSGGSPSSLGGSIATNEALDLCGMEHLAISFGQEESNDEGRGGGTHDTELEPSNSVRREKSLIAGHTSTRSLLGCKSSETATELSTHQPGHDDLQS